MKPLSITGLLVLITCLSAPLAYGGSVLRQIVLSQKIRIAYPENAYPMAYRDQDGQPQGYVIDLCRSLVTSMQHDLGLNGIAISWITGNTPKRLAAVTTGEADLDCGITRLTLARQRQVDFSYPVFVESSALLVAGDVEVAGLDDLAGKTIGVMPQTTTERRLRQRLDERAIDAQLRPVTDAKDGREQLQAGTIQVLAGDRLVLLAQLGRHDHDQRLRVIDTDLSVDPYAFALTRGDADFRLAVNRGLARLYGSQEIDHIFARWFGADAQPSPLLEAIYFLFALQD